LKLGRFQTPRRYPRDFTFYVADPISSILQIAFRAEQLNAAHPISEIPSSLK
jgi:hypothetical protein